MYQYSLDLIGLPCLSNGGKRITSYLPYSVTASGSWVGHQCSAVVSRQDKDNRQVGNGGELGVRRYVVVNVFIVGRYFRKCEKMGWER